MDEMQMRRRVQGQRLLREPFGAWAISSRRLTISEAAESGTLSVYEFKVDVDSSGEFDSVTRLSTLPRASSSNLAI